MAAIPRTVLIVTPPHTGKLFAVPTVAR